MSNDGFLDADSPRKHFEDMAHRTDPALMRLPHPKRLVLSGATEMLRLALGDLYDETFRALSDVHATKGIIIERLTKFAKFREWIQVSRDAPATYNLGSLDISLTEMRYRALQGRIFQIRDSLDSRLRETDIGADAPCQFLRSPFPSVFLELGTERCSPYTVSNTESGAHVIEGAYVTEASVVWPYDDATTPLMSALGVSRGTPCRVLEIVLIGSPLGKNGLLDDSTLFMNLVIPEDREDRPLAEVLEQHFQVFRQYLSNMPDYRPLATHEENELRTGIVHIAKILLYLHSENHVTQNYPAESTLGERVARVSERKRAKLKRRIMREYDRVIVGPEELQEATPAGKADASGRNVATHWRRGHFHYYLVGPGRQQRRLMFINPVLVNAKEIGAAPARNYDIK